MKTPTETLIKYYVEEGLSLLETAAKANMSYEPVRRRLIKAGIKLRKAHTPKRVLNIPKEFLLKHYVEEKRTQDQCAELFGCRSTAIYNALKKYGIQAHSRSEMLTGREFSQEHRERLSKAHLGKQAGDKNKRWDNNATLRNLSARIELGYTRWRRYVLKWKGDFCETCGKDLNASCHCCGHKPDKHVHHKVPFMENEELRYDLNNAVVLCHECHIRLHTKKGPLS